MDERRTREGKRHGDEESRQANRQRAGGASLLSYRLNVYGSSHLFSNVERTPSWRWFSSDPHR